jgi:hypothetical protein
MVKKMMEGFSESAEDFVGDNEYDVPDALRKKEIKKRRKAVFKVIKNVAFEFRPMDINTMLEDIRYKKENGNLKLEVAKVYKIIDLEYKDYDYFVGSFWSGNIDMGRIGGYDSDGSRLVVEIRAPNRQTLYIDQQGFECIGYYGVVCS